MVTSFGGRLGKIAIFTFFRRTGFPEQRIATSMHVPTAAMIALHLIKIW